MVRDQDVVDSSQLDVDLEAEVGQRLGRRLHHVFHLDTLRGHAQEGVSHTLHLRYTHTHTLCLLSLSRKYSATLHCIQTHFTALLELTLPQKKTCIRNTLSETKVIINTL